MFALFLFSNIPPPLNVAALLCVLRLLVPRAHGVANGNAAIQCAAIELADIAFCSIDTKATIF